jgi:hypothetical protein
LIGEIITRCCCLSVDDGALLGLHGGAADVVDSEALLLGLDVDGRAANLKHMTHCQEKVLLCI